MREIYFSKKQNYFYFYKIEIIFSELLKNENKHQKQKQKK